MTDFQKQLDKCTQLSGSKNISIWMPTHTNDTRQDPIRMKNLLSQAEEQLISQDIRVSDVAELLEPLRLILRDGGFWLHPSNALGVFLHEGRSQIFRIPFTTPQVVTVGRFFYVKPLFGDIQRNPNFYILILSKNKVQLLHANRLDVQPMELPNAPKNFGEFLQFDDTERHLEFHSGAARHQPGSRRPAVYHGQGAGVDEAQEKRRLQDYCRHIDAAVIHETHNQKGRVVLAALEPIEGVYRQISSCPRLDERRVEGNFDQAAPHEVHKKAVAVLENDFHQPIRDFQERYHQAASAGLSSNNLEDILRLTSMQAVQELLVCLEEPCWGRFIPENHRLEQHDDRQPGDEDLLNTAAVLAYHGGASVHAVPRNSIPDTAPAAAVLRFRPNP